MLKKSIASLFEEAHITDTALLPFSECRVTNARLLEEKEGFLPQSAILFLLPYYTKKPDGFSAYAASRDYHHFIKTLYASLLPRLEASFPPYRFYAYTDHAPIDERHAAVRAGLGVFGKNGLLLTEKYSSYQFIAEVLTDAPPALLGEAELHPLTACEDCGCCRLACPTGILRGEGEACLSAITQKKGELSEDEARLLIENDTVWGCDACQECCPYTLRAKKNGTIYTHIPYFLEDCIYALSYEAIEKMPKDTFKKYAFAWRGRQVLLRNLKIREKSEE